MFMMILLAFLSRPASSRPYVPFGGAIVRASLLGFLYDHSHQFLALRLDQNHLAFDHCGFEPPGLRHEFSDGRRNWRKAHTIRHECTNGCSKALGAALFFWVLL